MNKSALIFLKPVNAPLSARQAQILYKEENEWFRNNWGSATIYVIGKKHPIVVSNLTCSEDELVLEFDFIQDEEHLHLSVSTSIFEELLKEDISEVHQNDYQLGFKGVNGGWLWLTADRMIHLAEIGRIPQFEIPECFRSIDVLYVGISGCAIDRIFKNGHHRFQEILALEEKISDNIDLPEQIFIHFLRPEQIKITTYDGGSVDEFIDSGNTLSLDDKLYKDAEKALVSTLRPKYNREKFDRYPYSDDGLHIEGYNRYGFQIDTNYIFKTQSENLIGRYLGVEREKIDLLDKSSVIFVQKNEIRIIEERKERKIRTVD